MPPTNEGPCPLCGRDMIAGPSLNKHHLTPKTFGGKEAFLIHVVCHNKIHSVFTERELLHHYNTWEALRSHPEIISYTKWIRRKPAEFKTRHRATRNKRKRRR